jgi:hypothetical protein
MRDTPSLISRFTSSNFSSVPPRRSLILSRSKSHLRPSKKCCGHPKNTTLGNTERSLKKLIKPVIGQHKLVPAKMHIGVDGKVKQKANYHAKANLVIRHLAGVPLAHNGEFKSLSNCLALISSFRSALNDDSAPRCLGANGALLRDPKSGVYIARPIRYGFRIA